MLVLGLFIYSFINVILFFYPDIVDTTLDYMSMHNVHIYLSTDIGLGKAYYWIIVGVNFCKSRFYEQFNYLTLQTTI